MAVHPFNLWKRISLNSDEGYLTLKPGGETHPLRAVVSPYSLRRHHVA